LEHRSVTWKPTKRLAFAVPASRQYVAGSSCLLVAPADTDLRLCFSEVPRLQATWRFFFGIEERAVPRVGMEYWSLIINNGIEIG